MPPKRTGGPEIDRFTNRANSNSNARCLRFRRPTAERVWAMNDRRPSGRETPNRQRAIAVAAARQRGTPSKSSATGGAGLRLRRLESRCLEPNWLEPKWLRIHLHIYKSYIYISSILPNTVAEEAAHHSKLVQGDLAIPVPIYTMQQLEHPRRGHFKQHYS